MRINSARTIGACLGIALAASSRVALATPPTGLVEEPRLTSKNIAEADLDFAHASLQNEAQNITISGYVDISPGQGFLEIQVGSYGDQGVGPFDAFGLEPWIRLKEHITPSSTTRVVGSKTFHSFSITLKPFDLAHKEEFVDQGSAVWPEAGMGRIRIRAVRVNVQGMEGEQSFLPTRDAQGKPTRNGMIVLVDQNATPATVRGLFDRPHFLGVYTDPNIPGELPSTWTLEETDRYYGFVGTNPDGSGGGSGSSKNILNALHTLGDFKNRYFLNPPRPAGSPSTCSTRRITVDDEHGGAAIYFNKVDLGVGRKMRCNYNECTNETACYVGNFDFKNPGGAVFDQENGFGSSQDAVVADTPFATVAMVERGKMPFNALNKVFFVAYIHVGEYDGTRTPEQVQLQSIAREAVALDNGGFDLFLPGNCGICHGGVQYFLDPATGERGMIGAKFLPFDLQNSFSYYTSTKLTNPSRSAQEGKFKKLNQIVAKTDIWDTNVNGHLAARAIMNKWYGVAEDTKTPEEWTSSTFKNDQVPSAWQVTDTIDKASQSILYRKVVARSCRTCHLSQQDTTWGEFEVFKSSRVGIFTRVCRTAQASVSNFIMPQAEQANSAFWRSDARSHLVDKLDMTLGCGVTTDIQGPEPASVTSATATRTTSFYVDYAAAVCGCADTACLGSVEDQFAARLGTAGKVDAAAMASLKQASDCRKKIWSRSHP